MAKKKTKKKKKKGFTLIELLIVIAIIGILASVVLMSLNSARQRARMANFKAQASTLYTAVVVECDKTTPNLALAWPDATTGGVTTAYSCNANNEVGGGVYTSNSGNTGGSCVATFANTGLSFGAGC